jgi:hypothetical protein
MYEHEFARDHKSTCDKGVIDGVRTCAEDNSEHVVEGIAT